MNEDGRASSAREILNFFTELSRLCHSQHHFHYETSREIPSFTPRKEKKIASSCLPSSPEREEEEKSHKNVEEEKKKNCWKLIFKFYHLR